MADAQQTHFYLLDPTLDLGCVLSYQLLLTYKETLHPGAIAAAAFLT